MARTPKETEDRREQILDSALRVFAHKGFASASNKDIAREAGITTGLIYHYFESKAALLKSLLEERSPLHRPIDSDDVGAAAAYLLSDEADNVTATTLYVDSGYHSMGM